MPPAIEDYALIGDCRSAALISPSGSIDWLCWPRFDSPAIFSALLDDEGGAFALCPEGSFATKRRYIEESAVLQTTFSATDAEFVLTDAMPIYSPAVQRTLMTPEHEIVRTLVCERGEGVVALRFEPRTGFAQWNDRLRSRGKLGIRCETRQGLLTLNCSMPAQFDEAGQRATGTMLLRAGDSVHCSLTWTADAPAVLPSLRAQVERKIAHTLATWREWSARTRYDGPYATLVRRSLLTLRLLAYAPSGAIVAAATSSLPEVRGGSNNWDYRYCWLRDAASATRGLLELGHPEEAQGFRQWLLHSTRLSRPMLMVLYDVYGRAPSKERAVPGFAGYGGAQPVRIGNGAADQLQLDSYGETVDAVWRCAVAGQVLSSDDTRALEEFGLYVCEHWEEPDAGIWEPREEPQRRTHSLLLCWVALDRLIDLQERSVLKSRHRKRFEEIRSQIREIMFHRGYSETLHSYVSILDGHEVDATGLLLSLYGFEAPDSPRMRGTYAQIVQQLSPAPGLLYRNREVGDGGAFGMCSFWLTEHLALGGGSLADARACFEATAAYASDVGLFAELIEPVSGHALGNTPQSFTHVGLINAALSIAARERNESQMGPT